MSENKNSEDELMLARDAAKYLKIAVGTFNKRVKAGAIPFVQMGGAWRYYRRSDLDLYLEKLRAGRDVDN
jgi:excisionase family DNA binding protein